MTLALALLAALTYGSADFFGGLASRKMGAAAVTALAQIAGLAVLAAAFGVFPGRFYLADIGWGLAAGIFGALGIGALYAALAVGRMGLVSPITAVVGAAVPVVWGLLTGERPATAALFGIALACLAVVLVSTDAESRSPSLREPGLGLALVSGAAIGLLYVLLAHTHRDAGLTVLAASRLSSIPLLLAYALVRRETLRPPAGLWRTVAAAGCLDMSANVLYVLAARSGLISIAAVLTSLYPAATVGLAFVVLGERLSRVQWTGVACAACGIVLIAL